jgi:nucleoid DNA-binding protein
VEISQYQTAARLSFEIITNTAASEGQLELRNFGAFEIRTRKPRKEMSGRVLGR